MKERFFLTYFYSLVALVLPLMVSCYFLFAILPYTSYYPATSVAANIFSILCLTACLLSSLFNKLFKIKIALLILLLSVLGGASFGFLTTPTCYMSVFYGYVLVCNGINAAALIASLFILILSLRKFRSKNEEGTNGKTRLYFVFRLFFICTFLYSIALNIITIIYFDFFDWVSDHDAEYMLIFFSILLLLSVFIAIFLFGAKELVKHDKFIAAVCAFASFLLFTVSSGFFIFKMNEEYHGERMQERICEVRTDCEEQKLTSFETVSPAEEGQSYGEDYTEEVSEEEIPEETTPLDRIAPVYIDSIWPKDIKAPNMALAEEFYRNHWYHYGPLDIYLPRKPFSYEVDSLSLKDVPNSPGARRRNDESDNKKEIEFNRIISFIDKNRAEINLYGLFKAYKSKLYKYYSFKDYKDFEKEVDVLLRAYYDLEEENKFEEVYKHMKRTAAPLRSDEGLKQYKVLKPYISGYSYDVFTSNDRSYYTDYIKAYSFWGRRWKEGNIDDCYNVLVELQEHIQASS